MIINYKICSWKINQSPRKNLIAKSTYTVRYEKNNNQQYVVQDSEWCNKSVAVKDKRLQNVVVKTTPGKKYLKGNSK